MQYYASTRNDPRILLRLSNPTAALERWIPHRQAWVPMREHEDYISPFSSESMGTAELTKEEAEALKGVVPDMSEAFVLDYEYTPRA